MNLEPVYFDYFPNWKAAERGDVPGGRRLTVERRPVTPKEAKAVQLGDSPTMLVDGEDPLGSGDDRSVDLEGTVR